MYTLILMAAMTTAPDAPEFGGLFGRDRSGGCYSAERSCYGSCYGSCSGYSTGCSGSSSSGGLFSRLRAFFHRDGSCYGSCAGRVSGGYGSCTGRAYACYGAPHACFGGGPGVYDLPPAGLGGFAVPGPAVSFGGPIEAGHGCGGYALGVPTPVPDPFGPRTPFAPIPPVGDGVPQAVPIPATPPSVVPEDPLKRRNSAPTAPGLTTTAGTGRATVVVRLPADARLYAEGRPLTLTTAERTFVTPVLPADREFTYAFRVEYVRDGETISQTKKVPVKVGGTATLEFADLTAARGDKAPAEVAAKPAPVALPTAAPKPPAAAPATANPNAPERARLTVKLPPGATLYVDGKKSDGTEAVRQFSTPPLPPGQEFAYLMKAEVTRDGRPEYQLTKVTFRAGELVTVDFTAPPGK